jgi:hypothetical protein
MTRPWPLTAAVTLQWIAAVLSILIGFDLIAAAYEVNTTGAALQLEGALVNQGIIDVPATTLINALFVSGVLLIGIAFVRVMAAVFLARGRDWARILVASFAILNLFGGLAFLLQGDWLRAGSIAVLEAVVLWLLFNGRTNEYFRAQALDNG